MFNLLFVEPEIPGNTGNAIRLAAITGSALHLVEPLGFDFSDAKLRRAGLDYHDLAVVTVHPTLDAAFEALAGQRVFAFTSGGARRYDDVAYQPGDVLMFGRESVGLASEHLAHPAVTDTLRLPMLPARRSMNLSNTASVAVFEAWRQHDFAGAAPVPHQGS
ncbi:tRNA (cytidine(34)-2'-O)-methyltransferase [Falsarthrobacter nasiphocae]|uniref:Putative tRNA (cytidine(34)-2'-O)-methyltransferase n=1 Tax=Falsarthrobacter nasiphocae TaxID=189863 RepID=A0AAE3YDL5_9MICC|nr:tRNA (cytidine(34)-2'-O)-methyltransferase [Falsarthrobacter nasiphocae]MDR6891434.1 tRNA (cytidine/uridine-2'-O-)-methyltransferase [Falsarthrobacter nasiphocae]